MKNIYAFSNLQRDKHSFEKSFCCKHLANFLMLFLLLSLINGDLWGQAQSSTFSTAGATVWLCPAGVTSVTVKCYGGGGGGFGRTTGGAAGGGGGAYSQSTISVTDGQMNNGLMYYRLNQVDINGDNKIYGPITVDCENNSNNIALTFPNPSKTGFTLVINQNDLIGNAIVEIRDTKGAMVYSNAVNIEEGTNQINFSEAFAPGIYYITVTNGKAKSKVVKHSIF
jgi:hypothetical protein